MTRPLPEDLQVSQPWQFWPILPCTKVHCELLGARTRRKPRVACLLPATIRYSYASDRRVVVQPPTRDRTRVQSNVLGIVRCHLNIVSPRPSTNKHVCANCIICTKCGIVGVRDGWRAPRAGHAAVVEVVKSSNTWALGRPLRACVCDVRACVCACPRPPQGTRAGYFTQPLT